MRLTSPATILDFDPYASRTPAGATHAIGDLTQLADGRDFRHGKAGGSNVSKGKLQLAPAPKANHANIAVAAAAAANATQVTVTLGATAATAGEYNEGLVSVNDVDGQGQQYSVSSHPAADSAASLLLKLADGIATALTTSSEVTLIHNTWQAVVEGTAQTRRPGGVPLVDVIAGDFAWFQTKGVASVLADATITVGADVVAGSSTAGAVEARSDTAATAIDQVPVGQADILAGVDTEYRAISLAC